MSKRLNPKKNTNKTRTIHEAARQRFEAVPGAEDFCVNECGGMGLGEPAHTW